jgi:hypothetical protein
MTHQTTQPGPDSVLDDNGSPFSGLRMVARTTAAMRARKVEPTMRKLRRILGDEILDIFPEGLIDAVDQLHDAWRADPEPWAELDFETEAERDDALDLMRAYAECAGDKGYTIRTDPDTEPTVARFRVTTRRGSNKAEG